MMRIEEINIVAGRKAVRVSVGSDMHESPLIETIWDAIIKYTKKESIHIVRLRRKRDGNGTSMTLIYP